MEKDMKDSFDDVEKRSYMHNGEIKFMDELQEESFIEHKKTELIEMKKGLASVVGEVHSMGYSKVFRVAHIKYVPLIFICGYLFSLMPSLGVGIGVIIASSYLYKDKEMRGVAYMLIGIGLFLTGVFHAQSMSGYVSQVGFMPSPSEKTEFMFKLSFFLILPTLVLFRGLSILIVNMISYALGNNLRLMILTLFGLLPLLVGAILKLDIDYYNIF